MKILLFADTHSLLRNRIKQVLAKNISNPEFGEMISITEIFSEAGKKWDILILDINLSGRSGFEILKMLREEKKDIPVLVMGTQPEMQMAIRMLKSGASGYLPYDSPETELLNAVFLVSERKKYIPLPVVQQLFDKTTNPGNRASHELMSNREFEIFLLITSGKTILEIAAAFSLEIPVVIAYHTGIFKKTGLKTNEELVNYAIRCNLI